IIQSGLKDRLGKPVKEHFSDDHIKRLVAEMYSLPLDQVHCLITAWSNSQTIVYHVVGGILGKSEKLNFVMFISSDYLKRNLGVDFTRPDLMIGGYFRGAKWGMLVTDVVQMESEHGSTRLEDQETSQGLWLKFSDIIFTGLGADQIHYCFHDGKLTSSMLLLGLHSGLGGFKEDFDTFENALDLAFGSPSKSDIDEASQKEESFVLFTERSTQTTTIRHFLAGSPKDILAIHYIVFMSPE
ncbi:MAG TPA: hypothetical protein PK847_07655, partial [Candidatus Sumerlaeota bacterium]|nr:hypothetical protein [Candidatus Sumerlaeota bacterium]